ncbi:hypothetical protein G3N55_02970 [Dissulfurirhabdus thermomarina]|uniref:ABC transporter substrate-binding protein n=1 Tax=Dissulfurirhabdus thermomarina TaxID=1765737 RepID=A0A6N9TTI9_DISTH|nr:hypothetical protein [Dissulfurirhabdus thermomarina]NMX24043.1 hypothetical protein [Dissulfurirhabdus thermomarina]
MGRAATLAALCALLLALGPPAAPAAETTEVVAVLEGRLLPYLEAYQGISEGCGCQPAAVWLDTPVPQRELLRRIRARHPKIIVAMGSKVLRLLLTSQIKAPMVYGLVLNPWTFFNSRPKNVTGVAMNIAPEDYWWALLTLRPNARRVGLVYDPTQSAFLVEEAQRMTRKHHQVLVARAVSSPAEALHAIKEISPEIDAFWLLPDTTVIRREILDYLLLNSLRYKFVLMALSDKQVAAGALFSFDFDIRAMGRAAGEIVKVLQSGVPPSKVPLRWSPRPRLIINMKTAEKIGVRVPEDLAKASRLFD